MSKSKENSFVRSLEKLYENKDRAALAKLRRGLGRKGGTPEMYRYVVPYFDPERSYGTERYFLVASLFALHPESAARGTNMGRVFRAMKEEKSPSSVERRFENLLSVDAEDLAGHLRQAVSLAKSKGVRVDFHQLFFDIKNWNHPERFVQLQWARDFWGYENETNKTDSKGEDQ